MTLAVTQHSAAGDAGTETSTERPARRRLPGIEGVWAFVFADMTMFAVMFASFMLDRRHDRALFEHSRQALDIDFGGINTLILLTSSMLVVLAIDALRTGRIQRAPWLFGFALTCGLAFVVSKALEYSAKFHAGISLQTNPFFMYYFVLTGIHLVHVLVGNVVLAVLMLKSRSHRGNENRLVAYESGATYWHMVDVLWVCLFPLLYLLR